MRVALLLLAALAGCATPAAVDPASAADPSLAPEVVTESVDGDWTLTVTDPNGAARSFVGSGTPSLDPPAAFERAVLNVSWSADSQGPMFFRLRDGDKVVFEGPLDGSPTTFEFAADDPALAGDRLVAVVPGPSSAATMVRFLVEAAYTVPASAP